MKRIVLLVCAIVLTVANSAEARRRNSSYTNYSQPARVAPATYTTTAAQPVRVANYSPAPAQTSQVALASYSPTPVQPIAAAHNSMSPATAQGVANIMASRGMVGHFGGNTGYEGCGMGATPQAAFQSCCYSNSGMATVDVGYAQGRNGMWFCCRRYR